MSAFLGHLRSRDGRKDRDEDLLLFREMHRRANISLLQPVSTEFDLSSAGSIAVYRMPSGKKSSGSEFLADNDKNDYDWLKTPPATPLFPSLEMEPSAAGVPVHRELPIIQPLSRFARNSKDTNKMFHRTKPETPPRSVTPTSQRPSSSQSISRIKSPATASASTTIKPIITGSGLNSVAKPRSRGVLPPAIKPSAPSQLRGSSDKVIPRKVSKDCVTSGNLKPVLEEKTLKPRGRKEPITQASKVTTSSSFSPSSPSQKDKRGQIGGNRLLSLGSRMVDKVMNARKSGASGSKAPAPSQPDGSGAGRMTKHKDAGHDRTIGNPLLRHQGLKKQQLR